MRQQCVNNAYTTQLLLSLVSIDRYAEREEGDGCLDLGP